jgi:PadR family transcriptional regulator AphA
MARVRTEGLLVGEWACLGLLAEAPSHGFAVAKRLAPDGDVGRVWSLSRPLTYRAMGILSARGFIEAVGEEPGTAGGPRTIYAVTKAGRASLRRWLAEPVAHQRDVRSELLLKLVLCGIAGVEAAPLIAAQREAFAPMATTLAGEARRHPDDPVMLWRAESSRAVARFLDRVERAGRPAAGEAARLGPARPRGRGRS